MLPEMNRETSHLQDKFQKQAAVIGNPITHSKSPLIHNHFIRKYNINAIYTPIKIITESDLISIIVSGPSTGSLINLMQNFPDSGSGKHKVALRDDATLAS